MQINTYIEPRTHNTYIHEPRNYRYSVDWPE